MKVLQSLTIIVFLIVVFIPIIFFNFEPNSVSAIDNRVLTENPFSEDVEGDLTNNIESYINDRIGFRDEMILGYTVLNDSIFNKMVHPSYKYGKDGYVFGAGITANGIFSDYHVAFAEMVAQLQRYCDDRGVPFLFVFNPAKPAVLDQYIAGGINYGRDWVDMFFEELDKRGVNYLDNTTTLKNANDSGITVFNKKYDANHWNYTGAYYGTNKILELLKKSLPNTHINSLSEFIVSEETKYSLPVSNFPINEQVPKVELNTKYINKTADYVSELEVHPSYRTIGYYINEHRKSEGSPSALVFQGSYMNNFGYKYLINAFGEYIHIHDYQNIIDMPYYYNIFKPDCVVFEVAEYTFNETYFELEAMKNIKFNKPVASFGEIETVSKAVAEKDIVIESGKTLTKIIWNTDIEVEYVWLMLGEEFDMKKTDSGYETTVKTSVYEQYADNLSIAIKR